MTKNPTQKEFEKHSSKLVGTVLANSLVLIKKQEGC